MTAAEGAGRAARSDLGLVGLGVMGSSLALNIESRGFSLAVYNRNAEETEEFLRGRAADRAIVPTYDLQELVAAVERPRRILMMIKAGSPVDDVAEKLLSHLDEGDVLVDGGNSHWQDTERRVRRLSEAGVHFVGMGVSGGEKGAREGPSLMPGGSREAWQLLEPVLTRIAARTDSGPCVAHLGPGGAGHFVKMVHNGIEYGLMQLIAETYDLLRHAAALSTGELGRIFAAWNEAELESFLVEITAEVVDHPDDRGEGPLLDKVLDSAGQKGTGKWTVYAALDLGVPTPSIAAAVDARFLSALQEQRVAAAALWDERPQRLSDHRDTVIGDARAALYAAAVCCYAQGFALLAAASSEHGWELDLGEVARVWKGGCIIRAALLDDVMSAYRRRPDLANLLVDEQLRPRIAACSAALRAMLQRGAGAGIAMPAYGASLAYLDSYTRERLPANLLQALRDYFGAHTYERTDAEGSFHTDWDAS